jgi:methyl-accepting chemotaxis protein WspA
MEIRRLADQTAVATFDIEKAVKEMQSAVAAGVMGMDKFSDEVQSGVEEIHRGGARLAQIMHRVQQLTSRFQTIHEGVHAQVSGAEEISQALAELNDTARQTATSVDQSQATIAQLSEAAQRLQATVVRFKPDK